MIQAYDSRPHRWIALTLDNKLICAFDTLQECFDKAREKYGDDFYTTYGVIENYKKEQNMFVKIGSGIFNNEDIRAVTFDDEEITVYLKSDAENNEEPYTVDKNVDYDETIDVILNAINKKNET